MQETSANLDQEPLGTFEQLSRQLQLAVALAAVIIIAVAKTSKAL